MNIRISAFALVSVLGLVGGTIAEDKMATPMATDGTAMQGDAMQGDAMAMSADEMLTECLTKAGLEADAMKKDDATKACHEAHNMAGGAMATDAMATDAMAPAK